jgi:crotonobetainyl-CoA:carnitine CoA-transferase CaiB-like acyl-CoA transferase
VISVESQEEWVKFCDLVGHREWATDSRFADLAARVANRQQLDAAVESWTAELTPHQVMLILQRDGIAAGVVQTAEDLYRDPHLRERGFARDVYVPQIGWLTRAGSSVRMTEAPFIAKDEAHLAGEDNEIVLGELLGISKANMAVMTEQGVLR